MCLYPKGLKTWNGGRDKEMKKLHVRKVLTLLTRESQTRGARDEQVYVKRDDEKEEKKIKKAAYNYTYSTSISDKRCCLLIPN